MILPEGRIACVCCNHHVARRGSTLCSRCTQKGQIQKLRSTLPGVEPPELLHTRPDPVPDTPSEDNQLQLEIEAPVVTALPEGNTYNRKQVSKILGVSQTSICRWEKKGKTRPPLKHLASGKYIYTEEHLQELKKFITTFEQVQYAPPTEDQQKQTVAKSIGRKSFKLSRGLERAVSARLGRMSLRPGNLFKN